MRLAGRRPHLDVHKAPVAIQKGDLIDEIITLMAQFGRQRLRLKLRACEFERRTAPSDGAP